MILKRRKYKPRFKRHKRRKSLLKRRWFWRCLLGFVFIVSLGYLLFISNAFKLNNLAIKGIEGIRQVRVYNLLNKELGTSLFFIKKREVQDKVLRAFPELRAIDIDRKMFRALVLEAFERQPVAVCCPVIGTTTQECLLADETAAMFRGETSKHWDLPLVYVYKKAIKQEEIDKVLKIEGHIKKLNVEIEHFTLKESQRLDVKTKDKWQVYFDLSKDIDLALTKLRLLLEEEITLKKLKDLKYIDLRFTKAYYK